MPTVAYAKARRKPGAQAKAIQISQVGPQGPKHQAEVKLPSQELTASWIWSDWDLNRHLCSSANCATNTNPTLRFLGSPRWVVRIYFIGSKCHLDIKPNNVLELGNQPPGGAHSRSVLLQHWENTGIFPGSQGARNPGTLPENQGRRPISAVHPLSIRSPCARIKITDKIFHLLYTV